MNAAGMQVDLAVRAWAAWAPGLPDADAWRQWVQGERVIGSSAQADVSSVGKLQRRRLSNVTRMAISVVEQCLKNAAGFDPHGMHFVYCSRYGEYPRSFDILWDLVRKEPISPTAFSTSVHNTAASQFAIHRRDRSEFTALAAGETCLETAFVEAWSQINARDSGAVMIVYHDQPLPEIYKDQPTSVCGSLALALLVEQPAPHEGHRTLRLAWRPSDPATDRRRANSNTVLPLIRMLLGDSALIEQDTGRLVWTWTEADAHA